MARVHVTERWHTWNGARYRVWARPVPGATVPPLVLVHGYAACIEQWGRFIRDIGPDIPIYAVDLIGFGASSKPRYAPYGREFYLGQLEHLRMEYSLDRVVPVGHSLGGMLGIEWAAAQPAAIDSVVGIAPGGLLSGEEFSVWQRAIIRRLSAPYVTRALFSLITHLPYRALSAPAYADRAAMDPFTQAALRKAMRSPGAVWSYSALFRNHEAFDAEAHIAGVRCPVHIIWGTRDVQVPRAEVEALRSNFPHSTLTELDGGGHCVQEERSRAVAAEVRCLLVADGLLGPVPAPRCATG